MEKKIFELKDWYLSRHGSYRIGHGRVYGNPKFADGERIRTSDIAGFELEEDALLITTRKSIYKCEFSEHDDSYEDLEILVQELDEKTGTGNLVWAIKRASLERRRQRIKSLVEMISEPSERFIIICLSDKTECWDDCYIIKNEEHPSPLMNRMYISCGMFSDTVHIHERRVQISFHPNGDCPAFYSFRVPDDMDVYLYNSGSEVFPVAGSCFGPKGFELEPGVMRKTEIIKPPEMDPEYLRKVFGTEENSNDN